MRWLTVVVVALALMSSSCAGGRHLRVEPLHDSKEISGTFDLILFGGRYANDIETVAILDREGDGYVMKPFSAEFNFKTLKGLSAEDAIDKAFNHVSFHSSFAGTWLRRVFDETGTRIIGYELRPLYDPFTYGEYDVLKVDYWLREGGEVKVTIRIKERVERRLLMIEREKDSLSPRR